MNYRYGYVTYRHLFAGSDAGMYSYLWSKVLAMDMFDTVFKNDPLDDKAGRRYRNMVLKKGGSQDEMETLVQFLGRRPTFEAFYKSLGLNEVQRPYLSCGPEYQDMGPKMGCTAQFSTYKAVNRQG